MQFSAKILPSYQRVAQYHHKTEGIKLIVLLSLQETLLENLAIIGHESTPI